jgi:hypothetical protein
VSNKTRIKGNVPDGLSICSCPVGLNDSFSSAIHLLQTSFKKKGFQIPKVLCCVVWCGVVLCGVVWCRVVLLKFLLPTFLRHFSDFPTYLRLSDISPTFLLPRVCICRICGRYVGDMSEICRKYVGDMSEICRRYVGDMWEICRRYAGEMSECDTTEFFCHQRSRLRIL